MEEVHKYWKSHSVFPTPVGPKGLGDPDDRTLRNVEKEILIPRIMQEHVKKEYCKDLIEKFQKCSVDHPYAFFIKCRPENNEMKSCMEKWYQDEAYRARCTEEYLDRRSEYRRTGVGILDEAVQKRRARSEAFMRKMDEEDRARRAAAAATPKQ